jgi:predicted GNAT family N-acyltransferase
MTIRRSPNRVQIELRDWPSARAQAMPIRETVFVAEQGVPPEIEMDQFDAVSEHAIAIARGSEAIGTGRLLPDGHIGRMAVRKEWRGHGVGALILDALVQRAIERGFSVVMLNAQTYAMPFYAKAGFIAEGAEFMDAGIPHMAMRRVLRPV